MSATTTTAPSTTQAAPVPPDDIAAAVRTLGHDFSTDERKLMADGLADRRELFKKIRQRMIDPRTEPAIQFNPRLPGIVYPTSSDTFTLSDASPIEYSGDPRSLAFASAAHLSRLIHARKITSTELTKMYLDRLDTVGRKLNAVVTITADLALQQAQRADQELRDGKSRGPLHGIPYGVKDLLATRIYPTSWGVQPFAKQVFDYDATVVERLEAAGAVLCAKLSLGELAMGDVWFGGQTKNPWNTKQGSSGSSAGPCAAVAAGCVAFSIGSETMGSIVSPCMVNGTAGLRPTYGRISRYGAMALSRTMDKLGPIARNVEDLAMVLAIIHGPDDRDPTAASGIGFRWEPQSKIEDLRIGFDPAAFESMANRKTPPSAARTSRPSRRSARSRPRASSCRSIFRRRKNSPAWRASSSPPRARRASCRCWSMVTSRASCSRAKARGPTPSAKGR